MKQEISEEILKEIKKTLESIEYGSVTFHIQDGAIVYIEEVKKTKYKDFAKQRK